jgi:hypothetical protein
VLLRQVSDQSGRPDLNRRPLDPQKVGLAVLTGQSGSSGPALGAPTCRLFMRVHTVWSQSAPPKLRDCGDGYICWRRLDSEAGPVWQYHQHGPGDGERLRHGYPQRPVTHHHRAGGIPQPGKAAPGLRRPTAYRTADCDNRTPSRRSDRLCLRSSCPQAPRITGGSVSVSAHVPWRKDFTTHHWTGLADPEATNSVLACHRSRRAVGRDCLRPAGGLSTVCNKHPRRGHWPRQSHLAKPARCGHHMALTSRRKCFILGVRVTSAKNRAEE